MARHPLRWGLLERHSLKVLLFGVALVSLSLLSRSLRSKRVCALIGGAVLAFAWGGWRAHRHDLRLAEALSAWRVSGLIERSSVPLSAEVHTLSRRGERWSVTLELTPPHGSSLPPTQTLMALYRSTQLAPEIAVGSKVWLTPPPGAQGSLFTPLPSPDPLAFDRHGQLWRRGVSALARGELWLAEPSSALSLRLKRARESLRERFKARGELGQVAVAVGLGDSGALSQERLKQVQRLGLAHLFAVSGLHIGGVALLLGLLSRRLALSLGSLRPARCGLVAGLLGAWGLTVLVGAPLSAQRAAFMISALSLARLASLKLSPLGSLVTAGYLLTLMSPWRAQELSFQLSWGAVLGLCLMSPRLHGAGWLHSLRSTLLVSVSASLATAPLIAWSFGVFSPYAPLNNLLITPVATLTALPLCLLGTSALTCLELLSPELGCVRGSLGWLAEWLALSGARLLLLGVDLLPTHLAEELVVGRAGALMLLCLLLVWWQWCAQLELRGRLMALRLHDTEQVYAVWRSIIALKVGHRPLLLSVSLCVTVLGLSLCQRSPSPSVTTLSVGQGDASLLLSGEGGVALFDVGPRFGGRVIAEALTQRGIDWVDWVAVSHLHPDHYEGLFELLKRVKVGRVIYHGRPPQRASCNEPVSAERPSARRDAKRHATEGRSWACLVTLLNHQGVPLIIAKGRQRWGKLTLEWGLTSPPERLKENDASLSLFVSPSDHLTPQRGLLLSGDLERRGEQRLLASWPDRRQAFLWQADHHGSNTSNSAEALARLQPRVSLMSLGAGNRYGFPHPEVIARLSAQGASWLRTDLEGHITAEWSAQGLRLISHGEGLPRW